MASSRPRDIATVVLIFALAFGAGSRVFAREADARVSTSTITVVEGTVVVRHDGSTFVAAREGDVVAAGDSIRTAAGASAELTYFEGSSLRLASDALVVVGGLPTESERGTLREAMRVAERFWHVVAKLASGASRYEVRVPSWTASVRG